MMMMMKPMNNDSDEENSTHNNNHSHWLGFSLLSPHHIDDNNNSNHRMEISASSSSSSTTTSDVPQQQCSQTQASDLHSLPPQLSYGKHCYGVFSGGENGVGGPSSSPLSVTPLNSDGSLCLMEALSRSRAQGAPWNRFLFPKFPVFIFFNSCKS